MPQTADKHAAEDAVKKDDHGRKVYEAKPERAEKLSRKALRRSLMERTSKTMDLLAK